jgi:hypothetical protein
MGGNVSNIVNDLNLKFSWKRKYKNVIDEMVKEEFDHKMGIAVACNICNDPWVISCKCAKSRYINTLTLTDVQNYINKGNLR